MKIVATTLIVLLASVAIATVKACAEEVVANNVATSKEAKLENERIGQKATMMKLEKSGQINRNIMATRPAKQGVAEHVKTMPRPRPMTTAQKEKVAEVKAKLQAAAESQRKKYKSMEESLTRKEVNDRIMQHVHAAEKMKPPHKLPKPVPRKNPLVSEQLHNQRNSKAKSATIGHANHEVNPVQVDTEDIVQHARMSVERAKNMPTSFEQWEERVKQKMTHQQTAAAAKKNNKITSSAVHRYASPATRDNLAKEIEAEGKTIPHTPYRMPIQEREQQVMSQASRNYPPPGHNHETQYPGIPQRKVWENKVQARLEAMKANPWMWEEMKKRVEDDREVQMSAPNHADHPFSPDHHRSPSAVHRYASPATRDNLAKEIEAEGKTIPHTPYRMPIREREQVINQASRNYPQSGPNYETQYPGIPQHKVWENKVQARLEAMKANPPNLMWEEMKKRVEDDREVQMSASNHADHPLFPRRYPSPHPHLG